MVERKLIKGEDLEPEIGPMSFFIDAFREISSCRQFGFGVGPLPFTAIVEYSRLYDVGDLDEFLYFMRRLDDSYLGLVKQDQERKAKKNATKQPS